MGVSWTGSLSWDDEARQQRRATGKPANRRLVEIILCPTCQGTDIRCHRRTAVASYWCCNAGHGCPDWKESATAGDGGRAHLAG